MPENRHNFRGREIEDKTLNPTMFQLPGFWAKTLNCTRKPKCVAYGEAILIKIVQVKKKGTNMCKL